MGIDTFDESFASIEEVTHGLMEVVVRDLVSHPAPEILKASLSDGFTTTYAPLTNTPDLIWDLH